ncbi:MAG: hypothetical protein Q7S87_00845 [Agitococcus sp.]|nr:hypothetical protein [Agitococcus sp.]MDO9177148.1 hypothetical protein [Agitococcus sp.]
MKIERTQVTKLTVSDIKGLDPISVFLEDLGPAAGRITIACYTDSWTACWSSMGAQGIASFFCSFEPSYLAKNLSSIEFSVLDTDKLELLAKKAVKMLRKQRDITAEDASDMLEQIEKGLTEPMEEGALLSRIFGEDWWRDLPTKAHPHYTYLCRIIQAVQQALISSGTATLSTETLKALVPYAPS